MKETNHPVIIRVENPVVEHILPLLKRGLRAACDRHQIAEGEGTDGFSYGTDAWSLPNRLILNAIEANSIPFVRTKDLGYVFRHGEDRIRLHRVGWSEQDEIADSFPGGARALVYEFSNPAQGNLFPVEPEPKGGVVLAYMANPRIGLCAAYLVTVKSIEQGKVSEWADTKQIYAYSSSEEPPNPSPLDKNVAPPEPTQTPIIRRIPKKPSNAGST